MSAHFEDELQRALNESAAIAASDALQPLILEKKGNNSQTPLFRSDRTAPQEHHFSSYDGKTRQDGYFVSAPGLQQFHSAFRPLIRKYGTAGAICGYTTCAEICILLSAVRQMKKNQTTEKRQWSREEKIEYLLSQTRDVTKMMIEVERAMNFIFVKRNQWIDTHIDQFPTEKLKIHHLRGWVANYELSDAIFHLAISQESKRQGPTLPPPVDFVRFNQFHEISTATPDEYVRIKAEEERFGSRSHPQQCLLNHIHNIECQILYEEGDSMFIVERFETSEMIKANHTKRGIAAGPIIRQLQSPEEWTAYGQNCNSDDDNLRVYAVDLNGHFSAGFSMDGICVFINTTNTDYVRAEIMNWYYDLRFPPCQNTIQQQTMAAMTEAEMLEVVSDLYGGSGDDIGGGSIVAPPPDATEPSEMKANLEEEEMKDDQTSSSSSPPSLGRRSSSDRGGRLRVPSSSVVSDHDLATMMSMGFSEDASRRSLEMTDGNLMNAMNMLLG